MSYKTKNCGELRLRDMGHEAVLAGWVQKIRDLGSVLFIDLRDMHGITQLTFYSQNPLIEKARGLSREFLIQVKGEIIKRTSVNLENPTGEVEMIALDLKILNSSLTPPFTIEDQTDGNEELRMKYRYLDIRRAAIRENLVFRHKVSFQVRNYLSKEGFIEIETPMLIKSTPEGARDFIVPSRLNQGKFYALPQSPQTFKQLLMIGGIEKYFQIVKCFRDEDLRSDRQPEFTQIDCEMAFVKEEDILITFEKFISHLLEKLAGTTPLIFPRITYADAMKYYGSDKPDLRFDMKIGELTDLVKGKNVELFDNQESTLGILAPSCSSYTRKQLDELINWVKKPQIGASGLIWVKYLADGSFKSSVDKFFKEADFHHWVERFKAEKGDLFLILSGSEKKTRKQMGELRLKLGADLNLLDPKKFTPLWIVDFPLLEWNEDLKRYQALHHPFTRPKEEDLHLLEKSPEKVRAQAYDLVINGNEIGGGSIRIHEPALQSSLFKLLGFSKEETQEQFGFLLEAFRYGAPPHGGIAFGLDRLVATLSSSQASIRDFIAFPKNNLAKDLMIQAPSSLNQEQLEELCLKLDDKQLNP